MKATQTRNNNIVEENMKRQFGEMVRAHTCVLCGPLVQIGIEKKNPFFIFCLGEGQHFNHGGIIWV